MSKLNNILMGYAYVVTKFYAMLTFCINLITTDKFKIIFLFETTFFSLINPLHVQSAWSMRLPIGWALSVGFPSLVPGDFYQWRLFYKFSNTHYAA